ncbi:heat shock protein HspQ [Brevundimonas vitis]|uniref:Heat shock protein HspQ n=1 Tax=Brevundimonas vitisensis TaxID=2800818 RepID=A0ABX7BPP4_9CAUL|nr:heat shock protein HspQ [Brevundimonas vitisensis]QQQ19420.1 heat shock protein HspQ [Brevundimonas vitisensis]
MTQVRTARFGLGQIVRHREQAFSGVIVDVDPTYSGPLALTGPVQADQPFYRVFAVGPEGGFIVYAAENVLEHDPEVEPLSRADEAQWFSVDAMGRHAPRSHRLQ